MKKTFANEIKDEILFKERTPQEEKDFLYGIFLSLYKSEKDLISINIKNPSFKEQTLFLIKKNFKNFDFFNNQKIDRKVIKVDHFFAGLFFVSGSISPIESSQYHLQFSFNNHKISQMIFNKLKKNKLPFSFIEKKEKYILYIKKNERISDFLTSIGATKNFLKFTDKIIERDYRNQLNRISNLDIHNQNKLVDSNAIFREYFDNLKKYNFEKKFKKNQLIFYEFKKNHPFLPLSQLAMEFSKKTNIKKTKSGLNHWLIKLRKEIEDYEANIQKNKN